MHFLCTSYIHLYFAAHPFLSVSSLPLHILMPLPVMPSLIANPTDHFPCILEDTAYVSTSLGGLAWSILIVLFNFLLSILELLFILQFYKLAI